MAEIANNMFILGCLLLLHVLEPVAFNENLVVNSYLEKKWNQRIFLEIKTILKSYLKLVSKNPKYWNIKIY